MKLLLCLLLLALGAGSHRAEAAPQGRPLAYTGVNIAGGEFGRRSPGHAARYGTDYTFPTPAELDYFAGKGMNIIRLPFRWEDLQPQLGQPLDPANLERIKGVVSEASRRRMVVILDPHNYARFYDKPIGSPEAPITAFADFWGRLASPFRGNPNVWLGLMNEPHDLPAAQWLQAANAAIAAIRRAGAKNLILVPGIAYTGAQSWIASGNGAAMLGVKDPQHHFLYEVHQYLDADSSGTKPEAVSATIGSERLAQFTAWCRQHHKRAFLGEFAAGSSAVDAQAVEDMLRFMEQNRDVWVGDTWWAAGAWWGDYMFSLEPKNGADAPQLASLTPHLQQKPRQPSAGQARRKEASAVFRAGRYSR